MSNRDAPSGRILFRSGVLEREFRNLFNHSKIGRLVMPKTQAILAAVMVVVAASFFVVTLDSVEAGERCPANTTCVTISDYGPGPFAPVHKHKVVAASKQFTFCQPPKMWKAFLAYCSRHSLRPAWAVSNSQGGLGPRFDGRCGTITVKSGVHYGYLLPQAVRDYGGRRKLNWEF